MALSVTLTSAARRAFDRLAADCRRVFSGRLVAVLATGPQSSVVFVSSVAPDDLVALSTLVETWRRDGIDPPLLLTPEEFQRSLDTFPIEYQQILDRHLVIAGAPPLQHVTVAPDHLRRACEVQAKGHLIHLRHGWMTNGAHPDALERLVAQSASPLRSLLANVARLHGETFEDSDTAARAGARLAGLPEELVSDILAIEGAPEQAANVVQQLPEYLAASEQLWEFVDRWRGRA